jgi:FkbM family methyltransferase
VIFRRALRTVLPRAIALRIRREWLARRVVQGKGYKERDVQLLSRLLKPEDICWDIGATSGTYTAPMSRLAAQVFAFEPVPHNFEILQTVKRLGRLDNVSTRRLAISDTSGLARMVIPTDGFYGGYYLAALDDRGTLEVPSATVDGLIAQGVPEPDFIKCDVEGAEGRVIDGARSLIARRHPIWLLETFNDEVPVLMESLGYTMHVHAEDGHADEHRRSAGVPVPATDRTIRRRAAALARSSAISFCGALPPLVRQEGPGAPGRATSARLPHRLHESG